MRYEDRIKIYSDPNLIRFLRENSYWYKYINRRTDLSNFEKEMKEKYALTFKDKINRFSMGANLLKAFMDVTKEN